MRNKYRMYATVLFMLLLLVIPIDAATSGNVAYLADGTGMMCYYNNQSWMGIVKAGKEFNLNTELLESMNNRQIAANIAKLVKKNSLIITTGFNVQAEVTKAAEKYKDKKFAVIDVVVEKPNTLSVLFRKNEASFLAGVAAAKATKTNTIGFIGAFDINLINEFLAGYEAGAMSVNPEIEVVVNYINSFDNIQLMEKTAKDQHERGADVIMHAAGKAGDGLFKAVDRDGFWAIGVDYDQSQKSIKNKVLCSAVFKHDVASYTITRNFVQNLFEGGKIQRIGLKEEAVELGDGGGNLSTDLLACIEKYRKAIVANEIIVPDNLENLKSFIPKTL